MAQQFKNNARALLVSSINSSVTSIVIESAKADLFPVADVGTGSLPSASSWFKATLQDSSGAVEIVAVRTRTAGSGVLSNVIRGYDGTTALTFVAGTVVGLRITAVDVQTALDLPGQNNTFSGNNSFTGTNDFTGATTATTQTFGNNTTQLATTAFVQAALQALHPVGSIYTSTSATNPGTSFGFGTWVAFGAGRVLIGNGGGYSAGAVGGSADAIVVSHNHTATTTSTDSGHVHSYNTKTQTFAVTGSTVQCWNGDTGASTSTGYANISSSTTIASAGVSGTNANLQPYVVVYVWNRTA
jgi:hypothetical protein